MTPALRAGANYNNTGTAAATSLTVIVPSGVAIGDYLVIFVGSGQAANTDSVTTGTWVTAASQNTSGTSALFYHFYTGTEGWTPGTTTIGLHFANMTLVAAWIGAVGVTSGIDNSQFEAVGNTASSTISLPALVTSSTQDLMLGFWGISNGGGGTPPSVTVNANFTAFGTQSNTGASSGTNVGIIAGTWTVPTSGSTGAMNSAVATSHVGVAGAIAFLAVSPLAPYGRGTWRAQMA